MAWKTSILLQRCLGVKTYSPPSPQVVVVDGPPLITLNHSQLSIAHHHHRLSKLPPPLMVIDSGQRQWAMAVGNVRAMQLTGQWVMIVGNDSGQLMVSCDNVLTWEVIEGKSGGGGGGLDC